MGLTMFLLGLVFVAFVAAIIGISVVLKASDGAVVFFAVVLGGGIAIGSLFYSDKIALSTAGARLVTPQQAPELHGIVDRVCALADMPKPRVAIARTDVPNAFATGRSPKAAVVCATTGLLRRLDEPEVEAVLAHEISHVAHRDVAVMTIASGLGVIAGLLTRVMFYSEIFGGGRGRNNNSGGQLVMIEMIIMLVSIVVYALIPVNSFMLRFLVRILALPLIMGLSYEIIRFAAKHKGGLLAFITAPGLWLQRITTQPPSDDQAEVAIRALEGAMDIERQAGGELVID